MSDTYHARTAEIMERLSTDARRLRVGQRLPENDPLPWDAIQRVQSDFNFMLDQPGVTMEMIASALGPGFSRGTLSRFRNSKQREDYGNKVDEVTRSINTFLETIARRKQAKLPDDFVETQVAKRMLVVIAKTIELASIGVIYADAGRGKTMTLNAAARIHSGALLIRVLQHTKNATSLAVAVARAMRLRKASSGYAATMAIIDTLKGTGRCIMFDEAHQLSDQALEWIRDIHDETGCPIILSGTAKLNDTVNDHDAFFGQLSSRIALRYNVTDDLMGSSDGDGGTPLHSVDEIMRLYESDKVRLTDDGRMLLTRIANLPGLGGLRLCAKLIQVAQASAQGEAINAEHLLRVVRIMNDQNYAVHTLESAIQASARQVKIA